ncbi:hypothetical protein C4J81_17665 [Deltaproteobacteria bacterium Smac51]|nr:hypothetical protein C4J81_17665 [Deltaproteobacteria bacterium Smac51]
MSSTVSNTISGAIKWTGLGSDTDFASVVDSLVAIEERTITKQETWKSQWEEKLTAINTLDIRLEALKTGAESYDTREELLTRKATSSNESVATLSSLSTAATGTYTVQVGENIQEKLGSRTYSTTAGIGYLGHNTNSDGQALDKDGKVIGATDYNDANVQAVIDADGTVKLNDDGVYVSVIFDEDGEIESEEIIATSNPDDFYYPPMTISMGGKTLTLEYDPDAEPGNTDHKFNGDFTMEELADLINSVMSEPDYNGPNISVEIVYDKTRKETDDDGETVSVSHSRLVFTGNEGGQKNHITVKDPTNLCLDRTAIDQPVTGAMYGTTMVPVISEDSSYTGHTNKNVTFVATTGGTLGTDEITFTWADTEGNSGKFTLSPSDWDSENNCMKEDVEVLQGLKMNFQFGASGVVITNEAFSVDLQTPVMQKAADTGLAQTDKWVHKGFPDLTSSVTNGAGNFDFTYGGEEYSISISDGTTLSALVDKINSSSNNPGVIASVLNDGMGTATSYKLVLTGAHPGLENTIEILPSSKLNKLDCSPENFEHAREASNSMCRIDGYPSDGVSWIQRQTNDVGDVIDGVSVSLAGVGTTTVNVVNDVTGMMDKIKSIVEAVNYAKEYIKEQTKYGGGKLVSEVLSDGSFNRTTEGGDASGVMIGNYGFQMAQSDIDGLMTKAIFTRDEYINTIDPEKTSQALLSKQEQQALYEQYLEDNGLVYTRMTDIGIASDPENNGLYAIEESVLKEALTKNPEAVIKLFTFQPDESVAQKQPYADEDPRPSIGGFCVMMKYKMSDLTRSDDVIDSTTGEIVTPAKGIMKVLAANYTSIISGIDEKISREETRIALVRSRLEEKFARLETSLATLNNQSSSLEAQLAQLSS